MYISYDAPARAASHDSDAILAKDVRASSCEDKQTTDSGKEGYICKRGESGRRSVIVEEAESYEPPSRPHRCGSYIPLARAHENNSTR